MHPRARTSPGGPEHETFAENAAQPGRDAVLLHPVIEGFGIGDDHLQVSARAPEGKPAVVLDRGCPYIVSRPPAAIQVQV